MSRDAHESMVKRAWSGLITICFMFLIAGACLATVLMNNPPLDAAPIELPPCATEDSDNCWWDAARDGNGEGRSFVVIDGQISYLTK